MPLRTLLQERIEYRFPPRPADPRRISQHAVEVADRGIEAQPVYSNQLNEHPASTVGTAGRSNP